ncbi:MAG: epoxyqueuosine reductase [Chloroflexi bacterium]|nr:epoxyqueuosine reductase [Chloroflexota bacterium]
MAGESLQALSDELKALALASGAALAGVAAVDAIPPSTPPLPPTRVMAAARTVFVFGVPMLRGSIESPSLSSAMSSTNAIYREEDILSHRAGLLLEERGYRAALIAAASPIEMSKETKGLLGDISLRHAAVAAGLGRIGRNRLLLTAKYGPRVRLGALVTDAPLPPDAPVAQSPCDDCGLCVQACPAQALETHTLKDAIKCLGKQQTWGLAANLRYMERLFEASPEQRKALLRDPEYWNLYQAQSITLLYTCYECLNSCPVGR